MGDVVSEILAWIGQVLQNLLPWVLSVVTLIFGLFWDLVPKAIALIFWGCLIFGPIHLLLLCFHNLAERFAQTRSKTPGTIRATSGWVLAIMSLLTSIFGALVFGGLSQYTWHLIEQLSFLSEWSWAAWLKSGIGLIVSFAMMSCFYSALTYQNCFVVLGFINDRFTSAMRKPLYAMFALALLFGFMRPFAFEVPRGEVQLFRNHLVAKLTGAEVPIQLKGAVYSGVVLGTGTTIDSARYGYYTKKKVTVAFGHNHALISIDGLPLPCVVRGQQIIVPGLRNKDVWLELSYNDADDQLNYLLKNNLSEGIYTTEGVLFRTSETITDSELADELIKNIMGPI